ncbi:MAG: mechanosensitive ion channel family protein [Ignavibacteriales bacterium]|nr:mechanosensitive ion channel family protein [Ignavibacteriales bacterium]
MKSDRKKLIFVDIALAVLMGIVHYTILLQTDFKGGGEQSTLIQISYYLTGIIFWLFVSASVNSITAYYIFRMISEDKKDEPNELAVTILPRFVYVIAIGFIVTLVFEKSLLSAWFLIPAGGMIFIILVKSKMISLFSSSAVKTGRIFNEGDWIEVQNRFSAKNISGKIVFQNRRLIKIQTVENTLASVPKILLGQLVVFNYSSLGLKSPLDIEFTLNTAVPVPRAKRIILSGVKQALESMTYYLKPEPHIYVDSVTEKGITYILRVWYKPYDKYTPEMLKDKILETTLGNISKSGVGFGYPTQNVLVTNYDGKKADYYSIPEIKNILSSVDIFAHLHENELNILAESIAQITYKENEDIIVQGESGSSMFILAEGLLDVYLQTTNDTELKISQLIPGQFFGEMSLLTGEARSASVSAAVESLVYEISKDNFEKILKARPQMVKDLGKVIAERHMHTAKIIEGAEKQKKSFIEQFIKKIESFFGLKD